MSITIGPVRFSYAHIFTPYAREEGQDAKYTVTMLIPKHDTATKARIDQAMSEALQNGIGTFGGTMPAKPRIPIYDGDGLRPNGEPFGQECKGHWVMTASSRQRPGLVDSNMQPIIDQTAFYSGCYGYAAVNFFAYNRSGNKGVGCGLNNLLKTQDGEPLGGRTTPEEDFKGIAAAVQFTADVINPLTGKPVGA